MKYIILKNVLIVLLVVFIYALFKMTSGWVVYISVQQMSPMVKYRTQILVCKTHILHQTVYSSFH